MTWLRAFAFNIAWIAATVAIGTAGLPLMLGPRRAAMTFGRFWAQAVLALLAGIVGMRGEVRGRGNLPTGPYLVAMKHQSMWDTLMLPVVFGDPAVVIKRELLLVPFYGWYAARAGSIFVDRRGGAAALRHMVAAAKEAAAAGRPIVIFPQGTRTAPGDVGVPYQPGVAALYQGLGLPLVPAAVNSGLFWGRRSFVKRTGRAVISLLPPIPPGLPRREMMAELERRIEAETAALERETEAGYRGVGNQSSSAAPRIWSSE